jgi:hypothetical protein
VSQNIDPIKNTCGRNFPEVTPCPPCEGTSKLKADNEYQDFGTSPALIAILWVSQSIAPSPSSSFSQVLAAQEMIGLKESFTSTSADEWYL